jgi:hypothetical protein
MMKGRLAELVLHITNLIYFCSGVAVMVVGAVALGSPSAVINMLGYVPQISQLSEILNPSTIAIGPAIYLTVLGSLCIILSFVGCGGTFKKSKCVILNYGLFTLLLMLFNIAVVMFYAIDPYFIQDNVEYDMNKTLHSTFQPVSISSAGIITVPSNSTNPEAQAWIDMQFQQACCGTDGYADYRSFSWNSTFTISGVTYVNVSVPPSCCMLIQPNQIATSINQFVNLTACLTSAPLYTNTQGCGNYVMQEVTRYNFVYCVVAAGMTGLQAIILALTLWLLVVHFDLRLGVV